MVINESAYYEGHLWCAYELKDHSGNYLEELRLHMRKESQQNKFTCPDCGERLILCAGPIMEPFFKHHENSNCIINHKEVNRRNVVARRMLYHLAKDSYPNATIEVDKKLESGISPDIYIDTGEVKLVFEYLSYEVKLNLWEDKHRFYQENQIIDVWFLNYKRYQYEIKTTFEYMVSKYTKVLKFIDYESREIILKEKCETANNQVKLIAKAYPIEELTIGLDGEAICDYQRFKAEELSLLDYEEKLRKLHVMEQALKRNGIRESKVHSEEGVQQSLFDVDMQDNSFQDSKKEHSKVEDHQLTFYLTSINEIWKLPDLQGTIQEVNLANQRRERYLQQINLILGQTKNIIQRESIMKAARNKIDTKVQADEW